MTHALSLSPDKTDKRYNLIDALRGLTIISMIAYHTCWDLLYLGIAKDPALVYGPAAIIWERSICCSFILISGFCFSYGHHHLRRGLTALLCGMLITLVTWFLMPDAAAIFGVLWLLGLSTLLTAALRGCMSKLTGQALSMSPDYRDAAIRSTVSSKTSGITEEKPRPASVTADHPQGHRALSALYGLLCLLLFFITIDLSKGVLSLFGCVLLKLPDFLYRGYLMTLLGFTMPGFTSSDYFPLLPWYFLYLTGYFLQKTVVLPGVFKKEVPFLSAMGRYSLLIYMLHQPVIYGLLSLIAPALRGR
jgi:uncharacterized membrane protein